MSSTLVSVVELEENAMHITMGISKEMISTRANIMNEFPYFFSQGNISFE